MTDRAPRRIPRQERSRETVDAIFEATERLLRADSSEKLTMRSVARISGVSMGTLYQYFGTREALLAGWEEHAFALIMQRLLRVVAHLVEVPPSLEVAIFTFTTAAIEALEHHLSAYRSADSMLFSRSHQRHDIQERAAEAIVMALDNARDTARVRPLDRLSAARVAARTVPPFARDLATSVLDAAAKDAMRREVASMMVFFFVKDPDESQLFVDDDAKRAGERAR